MKKLYSFNDHPEHKEKLADWARRWIANAMSTKPMDDEERALCIEAVNGLYAAAKLPPPKHIVFVPSPFVLAFAGGFSAAIWHKFKIHAATRDATDDATRAATYAAIYDATDAATRDATDDATRAATYAAIYDATDAATRAATYDATYAATRAATGAATDDATDDATGAATYAATRAATRDATYAATRAATGAATDDATDDATRAATRAATYDATYAATRAATGAATDDATDDATGAATYAATRAATYAATDDATDDATRAADLSKWYVIPGDMSRIAKDLGVDYFGLHCAAMAYRMWQGGNQWSGYDSYLSFFQDIAKLGIDYSTYKHWRTLAEHSGPRIMHPDFCMISDRPEILMVDDQDRPHAESGPFCRWRDGSELYSWHGARIPARWILERETIDPSEILREENVEIRAAGISCVGYARMFDHLKGRVIHDSGSADIGELVELRIPGLREPGRFLRATCPRNGKIFEGVPMVSEIDGLPINTAIAAQAWRNGDPASEYQQPPIRT